LLIYKKSLAQKLLQWYRGHARLLPWRGVADPDYGGNLPASVGELRALPGIGRYTAAAIASIAFGVDVATLDGNIRRVLARVFNISEPLGASRTEKLLWKIASENLPEGNASEYNQGLMDSLGVPWREARTRRGFKGMLAT